MNGGMNKQLITRDYYLDLGDSKPRERMRSYSLFGLKYILATKT